METGNRRFFILTRRQFIKMMIAGAAALGLSPLVKWPTLAEAYDMKPAVIWLEGQDCAGCTESVITYEGIAEVILDVVNIRYHETIMAAAGDVAIVDALNATIDEGSYVLVVEGSIPLAEDGKYCVVAGETFEDTVRRAAGPALGILAIGACATYGGIPRAGVTDAKGVEDVIDAAHLGKLINLPGCPVHPNWFIDTALYFLGNLDNPAGPVPPLDGNRRPLMHFGCKVHDICSRRRYYNMGKYLTDWNNKGQRKWCLLLKGCKGPVTYANCPYIKWNQGANYCIDNNAPCAGCTEPDFYENLAPLFVGEPDGGHHGM